MQGKIQISVPGITQEQFDDAFQVLEECKATPCLGFIHPFMGPGGQYGNCWWERDTSLTLSGYCWLDQDFCEKVLENFTLVQKPNGRIPLWGNDRVGDLDPELSAIPVIFEVGRRICKRSTDKAFIRRVRDMFSRYLDWWLSPVKRDARTGLVCGIMEESDPSDYTEQLTYAPVDLNVQVAVGADVTAELSEYLGDAEEAQRCRRIFAEMKDIINRWLWDEETGTYNTRNVREDRLMTWRPYNFTFDVFRLGIVPEERRGRLLTLLRDDSKYGYDRKYGITTAPFDSPEFCETTGNYQGWTSWSGNIWTFRNEIIATGLRDSGAMAEAAHIAWQTVRTFSGNYAEFINPSTGAGQGVLRYGWSASQYIELIIEQLFGINYCAWDGSVTVSPNLPPELKGKPLSVSGLSLGDGRELSVKIDSKGGVSVRIG